MGQVCDDGHKHKRQKKYQYFYSKMHEHSKCREASRSCCLHVSCFSMTFSVILSDPLRICGCKLSYMPELGQSASLLDVTHEGGPENALPVCSPWKWKFPEEHNSSKNMMSIINRWSLLLSCFSPFRWLYNLTACTVYAFCGVLFGLCSLTNLTVLSCVCWLKVCCPNYGNPTSSLDVSS